MKSTYARDLFRNAEVGSAVEFYGWVKNRRVHSRIVFLDVVDSTGTVQCVVASDHDSAFSVASHVSVESAVKITGRIAIAERKQLSWELHVTAIEIVGDSTIDINPYPRSDIDINDARWQQQLLDKRHLYLRNPKVAAILRFRHLLTRIVHDWFDENGFMEIHAPVLTPTPLYDDRTPISLDVHGQNIYLTQCVGFYLESAVHSFEKIYNIGPSFRAEASRSNRHLMEYWHVKAELAFVDLEDMFGVVENFIKDVTERCLREGQEFAEILGTSICSDGLKAPYPRIDYAVAVEWLKSQGADCEFGRGFGPSEEDLLRQKFDDTPFWIVGIPRTIEPFPYVIDASDDRRTRTADLIASRGYGELLGIAEKINRLDMLDERLAEKGKAGDPRYEWLRELRQYGCVPHGGFGAGLERLIRWLLQVPHVRDTIPFQRTFGRKISP